MKIKNLYPGSWSSNCYVVSDSGHAIIIDPSAPEADIITYLNSENLTPDAIVMTHGHFDHISSLDTLRKVANIEAYIHESDGELLLDGEKNAFSVFLCGDLSFKPAEHMLHNGDVINFGNSRLKVFHVPGHTEGSICLIGEGVMFTGDTLFANGYGRFDLYSGNSDKLYHSLNLLFDFDPDIRIYPGHGEESTLKEALKNVYYF